MAHGNSRTGTITSPVFIVRMRPSIFGHSLRGWRWHLFVITTLVFAAVCARAETARNPIIYADVPDMAMIRVGDTYYMSSTTMHLSPGLPIMKSRSEEHTSELPS